MHRHPMSEMQSELREDTFLFLELLACGLVCLRACLLAKFKQLDLK